MEPSPPPPLVALVHRQLFTWVCHNCTNSQPIEPLPSELRAYVVCVAARLDAQRSLEGLVKAFNRKALVVRAVLQSRAAALRDAIRAADERAGEAAGADDEESSSDAAVSATQPIALQPELDRVAALYRRLIDVNRKSARRLQRVFPDLDHVAAGRIRVGEDGRVVLTGEAADAAAAGRAGAGGAATSTAAVASAYVRADSAGTTTTTSTGTSSSSFDAIAMMTTTCTGMLDAPPSLEALLADLPPPPDVAALTAALPAVPPVAPAVPRSALAAQVCTTCKVGYVAPSLTCVDLADAVRRERAADGSTGEGEGEGEGEAAAAAADEWAAVTGSAPAAAAAASFDLGAAVAAAASDLRFNTNMAVLETTLRVVAAGGASAAPGAPAAPAMAIVPTGNGMTAPQRALARAYLRSRGMDEAAVSRALAAITAAAGDGHGDASASASDATLETAAAAASSAIAGAHAAAAVDAALPLCRGGFAPLVALAYDDRMLLHEESTRTPTGNRLQGHLPGVMGLPVPPVPPHPERPDRLRAIAQHLVASGLWARCKPVPCRACHRWELSGVHHHDYLDMIDGLEEAVKAQATAAARRLARRVRQVAQRAAITGSVAPPSSTSSSSSSDAGSASSSGSGSGSPSSSDDDHPHDHDDEAAPVEDDGSATLHFGSDTFANRHTLAAAKLSCGGTLAVTEAVCRGHADRGVALVRPPGHHAEPGTAMGFCLYNNVAAAAFCAVEYWGVHRVMVVDWDVHHGNGTEDAFYDDPRCLYVSLHRHEGGSFYPGTGHARNVGRGAGAGYNLNVPWPRGGMGDAEYMFAFEEVVMPVARSFAPDLVLVSAGFDAARGDPLGGCDLTPAGYAHMTHALLSLASGRVVVVLEGGYNLRSIARGMEATMRVLQGQPPPPLTTVAPPPPAPPAAVPAAAAAGGGGGGGGASPLLVRRETDTGNGAPRVPASVHVPAWLERRRGMGVGPAVPAVPSADGAAGNHDGSDADAAADRAAAAAAAAHTAKAAALADAAARAASGISALPASATASASGAGAAGGSVGAGVSAGSSGVSRRSDAALLSSAAALAISSDALAARTRALLGGSSPATATTASAAAAAGPTDALLASGDVPLPPSTLLIADTLRPGPLPADVAATEAIARSAAAASGGDDADAAASDGDADGDDDERAAGHADRRHRHRHRVLSSLCPHPAAVEAVVEVLRIHSHYWPVLRTKYRAIADMVLARQAAAVAAATAAGGGSAFGAPGFPFAPAAFGGDDQRMEGGASASASVGYMSSATPSSTASPSPTRAGDDAASDEEGAGGHDHAGADGSDGEEGVGDGADAAAAGDDSDASGHVDRSDGGGHEDDDAPGAALSEGEEDGDDADDDDGEEDEEADATATAAADAMRRHALAAAAAGESSPESDTHGHAAGAAAGGGGGGGATSGVKRPFAAALATSPGGAGTSSGDKPSPAKRSRF